MRTGRIDVRRAIDADAPALAAIGNESFLAAYGTTAAAADIATHIDDHFGEHVIRSEMARPDREYLLATSGELPVGLAKLCWDRPPDIVTGPRPAQLQHLYVHSACQRAGAGRALLDATVASARQKGFETLWLEVWSEADWAVRFYRRHGFKRSGELPFYLGESCYDDWLMSLAL